jgi:hypothetical protein
MMFGNTGCNDSPCLVESPHPYPNNYNNTWTLTNPDTNAASTRVHFSRIETESGYDYVYVRDANNNQVSRFDGNRSDVWSAAVPGRTVKVQLTTDGSVTAWGFCVDRIETVSGGQPPAAPSNLRATPTDSTHIRLDWNDNSNNESGFKIYDGDTLVATVGANITSYTVGGLAPDSYHCYHIYAYNSYGNSPWTDWACARTPSGGCGGLAESPHPYPNNYNNTWTLTNPDTNAASTRVHFSRIETESGYDYVYVRDANNNQVSRFDGNRSDVWSAAVPGRTVKVQLTTDGSVTAWGFCVDRIETVSGAGNLALGKPAYASSVERGDESGFGPRNATDGNLNTRWSSRQQYKGGQDFEWIWVDLQGSYNINRVVLRWEAAYATIYEIQIWDGFNWVVVYRNNNGRGGVETINFSARNTCCVAMVGVRKVNSSWGYSLWEFEVY